MKAKLKLVTDASDTSSSTGRSPRALTRQDWICLGLLAAALLLAPLVAATFSTPTSSAMQLAAPEGLLGALSAVGIPLVVLLIVSALGVAIWREWQRPVAIGAAPGLAGSALLLAAWAALSLVREPALYVGLNALMTLLAALVVGGLVSRLSRDLRATAALLLTLIGAGTLVGCVGVREYLEYWKQGAPNHLSYAGFINPDFAAGYLLLTLPITLAVFVTAGDRKAERGIGDLALGFALVLQTACLLLTGSRTGAAALAVGLLVWLALCAWTGAAGGRGRRIGVALALVAISALLASGPIRGRLVEPAPAGAAKRASAARTVSVAPGTQSQSGKFRRYTWAATTAMARANPLLGTGIGSFDLAYPRYTETASTGHAHNSLLQWTAETGLTGALLLMAVFAAATAFAFNVLRLRRSLLLDREHALPEGVPTSRQISGQISGVLGLEPSLLIAGLLAALVASSLKTFMDSDWYIVPTTLALAALLGLLVGVSRDAAPLATQTPMPLSRSLLTGSALIGLLLLWRAGTTFNARLNMAGAALAAQNHQNQTAIDAYRAAIAADPFDPEARLALVPLYLGAQDADNAKAVLLEAARVAPTGKTYYRLGQFSMAAGQPEQAIDAYRHARTLEPKNLQNLRRLAEALASTGRYDEADAVYRTMTDLETSPYGTVRAIADELIETDFAYAHVGLARDAARRAQWAEAATQYAQAIDVMRLYWQRRHWLLNAIRGPQRRRELTGLYHEALVGRLEALRKQGADAATIEETTKELVQVEQDTAKDELKAQDEEKASADAAGGKP